MFRKGLFNDIKLNDSTNFSKILSSPPQADSTHIENGYKSPSGKLTPKRRAVSPLQNAKGITKISNSSPVLSRKIDPQVFTDVQSRGLASRIVKYHEMNKHNERSTLRSNYTKPGEFPIVNLNTKKELPYVVKRNLSSKNPPVRIAPPDKTSTNLNYRSSMLRSSGILIKNDNDPLVPTKLTAATDEVNIRTRSVLDELTEISRKRINNEELKIDSIKKTCIEGNGTTDKTDGVCIGLGGTGLGGNKKRQRDLSFSTSPTSISPTKLDNLHLNKKNCTLNKKPPVIKNNDILSSLSSSMIFPNAKLNRNSKNIINHPNSYNTNNVFLQSIGGEYHNRLPTFDAQPSHANKSNLVQASSSPVVQTTYNTSNVMGVNASNVVQTRSEPPKPATQKLLLFNRPEVPQQHTIKISQTSEDTTVSFVKPKQIIDNNLIIEPSKINENSLVKRKSNLTGIERSKLAMMLEYLKSDDEEDDEKAKDEIDSKTVEPAIFTKPNVSNIMSTVAPIASSLSSLPLTTLTSTTPQTFAVSSLPTISSEKTKSLTTTVTAASVSPVITSKISTTLDSTHNTPTAVIHESIVTPNVTPIETKAEVLSTVTLSTPRIGGFSFPINSASTKTNTESSSIPVISSSSDTNTTASFSFDGKINPIESRVSFSPLTSGSESQPHTNQTFSFFNKPNTSPATTKLPAPQPNSSINVSSHQAILPTSLINFSSPQKDSTPISKPPVEGISYSAAAQSPARIGLNVTFGGIGIPGKPEKANSTIVPVTTAVSKFSFTGNNSNSAVNSTFSEPTTAPNMFNFASSGYNSTDLSRINKSKTQTSTPPAQPASTVTTESSLTFMQNTGVANPSVSVVKPFSFSASNITAGPVATDNSMFNSGNQQNKNMFGNFAASSTTTTAPFAFGDKPVPATGQNNGFGNPLQTSTQQNNVFGTVQAPTVQPNNVFGNNQEPATSSNNPETTLFNFKTTTANNTTNQNTVLSNIETSSNVFKLRSGGISNTDNFGTQQASNVFGGSGMQQKNDIFGGGMTNNIAKPAGGVFNFTTNTTHANSTPASFLFGGINKNQPIASNANVFGSLNNEQSKTFGFGGGSTQSKTQTPPPPPFGSINDTSKNFTFGQTAAVPNTNNTSKLPPPVFGTNMFVNSNTDTAKLEPSKSAFGFAPPNLTQSQPPTQGMFSFTNNSNLGHSNNNMNSPPASVFGQASGQPVTPQNPFSIGPGANAARRPVRTAMRRLNK